MSHNPEQYGYHDEAKTARIAKLVQRAMRQQNCAGSSHFHEDDCAGCNQFIECARQQEDFDAECYCPYCYWLGQWADVNVKTTPQTMQDPEERQYFCPLCGRGVEDASE